MEEKHVEAKSTMGNNSVNEYSTSVLNTNLNKLRKEGKLCDIVIKIDDMEYSANKIVLATFSPYFEAMFCGNFTEAEKSFVSLSNIDGNIMEIILDYAYTASIEITTSNVQAILHAANFLQARPLFESCCHFLENTLAFDNCVGIWNVAEAYSCSFLKKSSEKDILDHFAEVSEECEFLELEPGRLIEIIKSDSLIVEKEDVVLNAVIQWFHYKEGRAGALKDVLSQVRLAHVDPQYLYDRVKAVPAIRDSPECMNIIAEAQKYFSFPNRRLDFQSSITRRRFNSSHVEALVVLRIEPGDSFNTTILITEDLRIVNFQIPSLPAASTPFISYHSNFERVAFCEDYKRIWRYKIETGDWIAMAPLEGNRNIALAHLDNYWYAVGGSLPSDRTVQPNVKKAETDVDVRRNVLRYNPSDNAWKAVARLPEPFTKPAVVTVGGMVYVIGTVGKMEKIEIRVVKVQRYDPLTDVWTEETSLRSQLDLPFACAMNSRIYVCSRATKREVNVYDCTTAKWDRCSDMTNSFVSEMVVMNGRIFAVSERADGQRVIERYSPVADSWQEFAIFPGCTLNAIRSPLFFSRDRIAKETEVEITPLV